MHDDEASEDKATAKSSRGSALEKRIDRIRAKRATVKPEVDPADSAEPRQGARLRRSGKDGGSIRRSAEQVLRHYAEQANIEQYDLFPGDEYPTPFTRLPLFVPAQRKKAREAQIAATRNEDFVKLNSRWDRGGVYRAGPALTVYDEDTFIGLLHLRAMGFAGTASRMPSKRIGKTPGELVSASVSKVKVHAGYCVVSQLETVIRGTAPPKKGWSGRDIALRRESIERLGATILRFTSPQNLDHYRGKQIQMLSIDWIGDKSDACYYFEFHPAIVRWLEEFRTYVDLKIRRKLTPFGRALHRFLSSQKSNKRYDVEWATVLEAIGFRGSAGNAKRLGLEQLEKMVSLGFIAEARIDGTGRRDPFMLRVVF